MTGKQDVTSLIEQLNDDNPRDGDAQWRAAIALGNAESPGDRQQAREALVRVLSDGRSHHLTRAHAVESLGRLNARDAARVVAEALKDPHHLVRSSAAAALASLGGRHSILALLEALETDDYFSVRAEACQSLSVLVLRESASTREDMAGRLRQCRSLELSRQEESSARVLIEIERALRLLDGGDT
jgi:HEAT repeat protein